jgi:hypothetical protein
MIPGVVPDINICSFNNGSFKSSTSNTSRKNTAPLSLESGFVDLLKKGKPKELDRSQFSDIELAFIDLYHRICIPAGLGFCQLLSDPRNSTKCSVFSPRISIHSNGLHAFERLSNTGAKYLEPIRESTTRLCKSAGS